MPVLATRRPALRLAFASLLAFACQGSVTEIVIVVDSELAIPEEVDRIDLRVTRQRDKRIVAEASVFLAAAATSFPVTWSLERKDGEPGPMTVEVQAKLRGEPVVFRSKSEVQFAAGQILMLRMDILQACRVPDSCPPPGELAPWQGPPAAWARPLPLPLDDAGLRNDADAIAEPADAGPLAADAQACTTDCKRSCDDGQSCMTVCADDGDCSLTCDDDGTTCDLQSPAAKTSSLTCKNRARCTLSTLVRAKEGRAVCEDNAWCDMLCESPGCQLDCREAQCRMRTRANASTSIITCTKKAECSLDLAAGNDNGVVCTGSTCAVTCRGNASCSLKCLGNSTCTLTCSTSGTCELANCPKPQLVDCGAGVFVCGRGCP